MKRIKSLLKKKGVMPAVTALIFAVAAAVCMKVCPNTVEYTVKPDAVKQDETVSHELVPQSSEQQRQVFTVKYIDGRVCVMNGTQKMHEVKIDYANLSSSDKKRLNEGITVDSENELLYLTQYLES